MGQARIASALCLTAANIPGTRIKRAFGFGAEAPESPTELDEAIKHMRSNAGPRWWLQPGPLGKNLPGWPGQRGFNRAPRPWAKMARRAEPPAQADKPCKVEGFGAPDSGAFAEVICAGFGAPPAMAAWFKPLVGCGQTGAFTWPATAADLCRAQPCGPDVARPGLASPQQIPVRATGERRAR
jgi:hypothetical protein